MCLVGEGNAVTLVVSNGLDYTPVFCSVFPAPQWDIPYPKCKKKKAL